MVKSSLAQVSEGLNCSEADAIHALKSELEKGVESMKQDDLYTIEEAWKEIDAI